MYGKSVPNPTIRVWANRDQVDAMGWAIGENVILQAGGREFNSTVQSADWDPNYGFVKIQLSGTVDLQPGDTVSLTNGKITKTTTITEVAITSVDVDNDVVRGKALPFSNISIWASSFNDWFVRYVTADENGNWVADFAHPGNGSDEQNQVDIVYWSWIDAEQADNDGDVTLYGNPVPTPFNIYIMDSKTGISSQLTQLPASGEYNPSWSTNGKFVAYNVIGIDKLGVYLTNTSTGVSTPLRGADGGTNPAWSPNDRWIAFERNWVDEPNLYYVPAAGGEKRLVRKNATHVAWAPSGSRLAFQDLVDGKIKTINLSGFDETVVADYGSTPDWSLSGEWIAFEQDGNIWKVRVNMKGEPLSDPIQLTNEPEFEGLPAWSANDKWIVFQKGATDNYELWQIPATGGTAIRLKDTVGFKNAENPTYSSNGQYLAFSGITSGFAISNKEISSPAGSQGYRSITVPLIPDAEIRIRRIAKIAPFEIKAKSPIVYPNVP
jgi:hypothetical protein